MELRNNFDKIMNEPLDYYYQNKLKPLIEELKFKEEYQSRIINAMTNDLDDDYVTTPIHEFKSFKLENSKEGPIKVPRVMGETLLNHLHVPLNLEEKLPVVKDMRNIKSNTTYTFVSNNPNAYASLTTDDKQPVMNGLKLWLDGRDGRTGTWKDRTEYGNDGTLANLNPNNSWKGTYLQTFTDGVVNVKKLSEILDNNKTFTLQMDVKVNEHSSIDDSYYYLAHGSLNFQIRFKSNGTIFTFINGAERIYGDVIPYGNRLSHTLVMNEFKKTAKIYTNGKHVVTLKYAKIDQEYYDVQPICIGGVVPWFGGNPIQLQKMNIHSVKLYDRPLTDDEIKYNYEYEQSVRREMISYTNGCSKITTPPDPVDPSILKLCVEGEGMMKDGMLLEGDWTNKPIPNFFQNFSSTGETENNKLVFKVNNKNLWNEEELNNEDFTTVFEHTKYESKRCIKSIKKDWKTVQLCKNKFKKSTQYRIEYVAKNIDVTAQGTGCYFTFVYTDGTDTPIYSNVNNTWNKNERFSTANKTIDHIRINNTANSTSYIDLDSIMITEGVNTETYVRPQSNLSETIINEPLRCLPNGLGDEINDGVIKRVVLSYLVTGNENFGHELISNTHIRYTILLPDAIGTWTEEGNVWSNYLKDDAPEAYYATDKCIGLDARGLLYISIPLDELESPTLESFRNYLKINKLLILAKKAIETEEELITPISLQGYDDSTITVENNIMPTVSYKYNVLAPYKEALKKQGVEVGNNILDINNNIVPYLMDMEYALLELEMGE